MTAQRPARSTRGRTIPTGRGISMLLLGAAFIGTGAAFDRVELTFVGAVFVLTLVLGMITVLLVRVPRTISRDIGAEIVAVGDPLPVTTAIHGGTVEFIDGAADRASDGLERSDERSHNDDTFLCTMTAHRRGLHRVGPLRVRLVSPLRAARRAVDVGPSSEVIAVPPVVALATLHARGLEDGDQPSMRERIGQGADNLIPRPYVPGDSMRRVHWRASAHHGDLMVRDEERESTPTALVMLDMDREAWPHGETFDLALSACVSATARLRADGFVVDVEAADGSPIAAVDSRATFDDLRVACAVLEPRGQGSVTMRSASDAGAVVMIGRASRPAATPAPHILLTPESVPPAASTSGWRVAVLDDVARAWTAALDEVPR